MLVRMFGLALIVACLCGPADEPTSFDVARGGGVSTIEGAQTARATIADVAWIGGTWVGGAGPQSLEERWTPPGGGAMLGVSRTIRDGKMIEFEYLRIVERDGGLVYVAQPNGRPPTEFVLTAIDPASATFENPQHDYPKMIRYAKRADGGLDATISAGGSTRARTFTFKREER
jgi:hypothetical protein